MKFVAQRVASAALCVSGELVSEIGRGLVVYLGVKAGDNEKQAEKAMEKVALLRVFEDEAGKMNLSVRDVKGEVLLVSQFTLYGDAKKGNRPSFSEAERPERADAPKRATAPLFPRRSAPNAPTLCMSTPSLISVLWAFPSKRASSARICRYLSTTTGP